MRKTNLLALSVLTVVLLSSAFFSLAAAQESIDGTEPAFTPDASTVPEPPVDPDAADKADETRISPSEGNATNPDTPATDEDAILYTTQDTENGLIAQAPGAEDANLESAQTSPDYTLPIIALGAISAVLVGGVLGLVYYRKQATKAEN